MTKSIFGTLAAAVTVMFPLATAGAASGSVQDDQNAQSESNRFMDECAMVKDPNERAACIREGIRASGGSDSSDSKSG